MSQTSRKEKQQEITKEENKYILTLPYVNGIVVLKRKLEKYQVKVYFSYPQKLQSSCTSSMKSISRSNIYQIQYTCGAVYNGETKLGLSTRMKQHQRIIEKDSKDSKPEIVQYHQAKRH